jgi:hypothetical protein
VNEGRRLTPDPVTTDNKFSYTINVVDGQTIAPIFTFIEGYPRARIEFGDQTPSKSVVSGFPIPHTYKKRGIYTIRLMSVSQEAYLQMVDIRDQPLVISENWPELLDLQALSRLHNQWYVGYGEIGIAKIVRGTTEHIPAWKIGFGVVGLFSVEIER